MMNMKPPKAPRMARQKSFGMPKPKGMKSGGPTSMDMRKYGRNLAHIKNQKGG